jgi:uncharacterized protein (DUF2141 family)
MRGTRLITIFFCLVPVAAWAGELSVTIDGVASGKGSVLGALYASDSTWFNPASAQARFKVRAAPGSVGFVFHDLPAGHFALSVFHDANDNGKLDKNFLGVPEEGYGFSNDALGSGGPPKFTQAAFDFDGKAKSLTINLNY